MKYILSMDQGTTSSRAIIFNEQGEKVSFSQRPFKQYFPKPGWVEHDALEIWYTQYSVATEAMAKADLSSDQIACIGITNQRETTVVWDRETSQPICPAIVWQDRRTAAFCEELVAQGFTDTIRSKTGLIPDAYFSATKIRWILDNVPGARKRAAKGELCFGTIDSWLLWKLTGGKVHMTDVTNASRTMLFNIHTLKWDDDLLKLFDISPSMMPKVKISSYPFCHTAKNIFSTPVTVSGIAGDQQAALFGQLCLDPGMAKTTYGTGCFLMMNTGNTPVLSNNGMLTTIAWMLDKQPVYALEGSVFVGGAVVQWLRDEMKMVPTAQSTESIALSVPDNGGVFFVPALTGLGAPYWDPYARGAIVGLTRGTGIAHITRAALEGIAYQVNDVLSSMHLDCEKVLGNLEHTEMRVDGGAVENNFLMQFQSDISRMSVLRPKELETTALGAAYLAGLGVGLWSGTDALCRQARMDRRFEPNMNVDQAQKLLSCWKEAVRRAQKWDNTL